MRVPHHADWLYAIGDVNGRALVTHAGKYQAAVAAATIMNRAASADWDGPLTPQVVFTEPQVASVGYTLEARARGRHPGAGGRRRPRRDPGRQLRRQGRTQRARGSSSTRSAR